MAVYNTPGARREEGYFRSSACKPEEVVWLFATLPRGVHALDVCYMNMSFTSHTNSVFYLQTKSA